MTLNQALKQAGYQTKKVDANTWVATRPHHRVLTIECDDKNRIDVSYVGTDFIDMSKEVIYHKTVDEIIADLID